MDHGIGGGNNTSGGTNAAAVINTASGTFIGILQNFTKLGNVSNFVCSQAGPIYPDYTKLSVVIQDPTLTSIETQICSGEQVHFSIQDQLMAARIVPGTPILWEYNDDFTTWQTAGTVFDNKYNFL